VWSLATSGGGDEVEVVLLQLGREAAVFPLPYVLADTAVVHHDLAQLLPIAALLKLLLLQRQGCCFRRRWRGG
jgi:hypothetical protein